LPGKLIGKKDFYRSGGIRERAEDQNYELIIVWPSDEAINFYKKNGFVHCQEPMVNQLG